MDITWVLGTIITIVFSSLMLTEFSILYRIIFGIFLVLLIVIIYLIVSIISLKKNTSEKAKQKDKTIEISIENLKKSVESFDEMKNEFKTILNQHNIPEPNLVELLKTQKEVNDYLDDMDAQKDERKVTHLNVNSKTALLAYLNGINKPETVIFYSDNDREARIEYTKSSGWEFYYYRKGFETLVKDFCLDGVINNEYFENAISWIKLKQDLSTKMEEYKTSIINFNKDYDMIVIENYPQKFYHYVLLKEKNDFLVGICDDCVYTKKHNHNWTSLHKGYCLNFPVAKSASFDIGYLQEKFRIDEKEAAYMAKILSKNFGLKFRDLKEDI